MAAFLVLGSVFLVVTGGEALYADMGHFGRSPIRLAWFAVVLPALLLNYFGQGALLLARPGGGAQPVLSMAPDWALYPLVVLATVATVIASQAVISGAFSLTRQAVQLGFLPRLTSSTRPPRSRPDLHPEVNWLLMFASIGLVLGSALSRLAAAYGVAVTTTWSSRPFCFVWSRARWGWNGLVDRRRWRAVPRGRPRLLRRQHRQDRPGGWFPLVVGGLIFMLMTTWQPGRRSSPSDCSVSARARHLLRALRADPPHRIARHRRCS